jgi:hypothetical protein
MAMPRKAMKELGFQACCLRCDASDEVGSSRCRSCIENHRQTRELIARAPQDDPLFRFARSLSMMAASPHRYDHDAIHGSSLSEQQRLATELIEITPVATAKEIGETFAAQENKIDFSPIRDVSNQNTWGKEGATRDQVAEAGKMLPYTEQPSASQTKPNKEIQTIDRSDRIGEDLELGDRLHAIEKSAHSSEEAVVAAEKKVLEQRKQARTDWSEVVTGISGLLDVDDLDL